MDIYMDEEEYSPDSTMNPDMYLMQPLTKVVKREIVGDDEEEEVIVDDQLIESEDPVERMMENLEGTEKRYILLPKSGDLLLSVSSGTTDGEGVDESSLLDTVPSSLGAYTVAPPTSAYSTADFSMDGYTLQSHLPATYVTYDTTAYQTYYQYPSTMPSPTSSTSYILPSNLTANSPSSGEEDSGGGPMTSAQHAARASPATIAWLKANYERAEGSSLPRCTLYEHYKRHCHQSGLDAVNAASFGKLIRSIFEGLRTRRLGTRGNSKYHYYGIRLRANSALETFASEYACDPPVVRSTKRSGKSECSYSSAQGGRSSRANVSPTSSTTVSPQDTIVSSQPIDTTSQSDSKPMDYLQSTVSSSEDQVKIMVGSGEVPRYTIPSSPDIDRYLHQLDLNFDHVIKFVDAYHTNCQEVLYCVRELRFEGVEEAWSRFWQHDELGVIGPDSIPLTREIKIALCSLPQVKKFVAVTDFAFFQVICEVLVPDLLATKVNLTVSESTNILLRNFARNVEATARKTSEGAPEDIVRRKEIAARMMARTVRKYTSISHLSHAARIVCNSDESTRCMLDDLNRVDLSIVQEQAEWVSRCDPMMVRQLTESFKENITKRKSLDEWAEWMEAVLDQVLAKYHDQPLVEQAKHSKQFLLNWSFYSSMVIRDLTLRSAHSFGHFHLMRLLFDEYLLHLVETRLAKTANKPVLAVMAMTVLDEEDLALLDYTSIAKVDLPSQSHMYTSEAAAFIAGDHHLI